MGLGLGLGFVSGVGGRGSCCLGASASGTHLRRLGLIRRGGGRRVGSELGGVLIEVHWGHIVVALEAVGGWCEGVGAGLGSGWVGIFGAVVGSHVFMRL